MCSELFPFAGEGLDWSLVDLDGQLQQKSTEEDNPDPVGLPISHFFHSPTEHITIHDLMTSGPVRDTVRATSCKQFGVQVPSNLSLK